MASWVPGNPPGQKIMEGETSRQQAEKKQQDIIKTSIFIWNTLVENKGPNGLKQDELGWNRRIKELANHDGFQSFINAKTIEDKITALRDTGMRGGQDMQDEQLAQYILTHSPMSLTDDPVVSTETRLLEEEMNKPKSVLDSGDNGMEKFKEDYPAPEGFWEKYGIK
tara:strand:+ start:51 stop:551 length:501 start_codon:yes stop_codon:yes gene_type:complete